MDVRFWGTRGSIPKAAQDTLRYGGNTSCVEVRSTAGTLVILDCGTGAHPLGQALLAANRPLRGHILITHYHWDHIQGMPFFAPLFAPAHEWDIYGPRGLGESLRSTLAGQMQYTHFPVTLEQLEAKIRYHDLVEGVFEIDDVRVTARYLNHTSLTLGYRLEADGASVVYATDHEPHSRSLAAARSTEIGGQDRRHVEFLREADLVIHDTQYRAHEYADKVGWGHSTMEYVVDVAAAAGVRRLAMFHHDPLRDDEAIDLLLQQARDRAVAAGSPMELFAAAEGQSLELTGEERVRRAPEVARPSARAEPQSALLSRSVLVAVDDPTLAVILSDAVRADGVRLLVADSGDQVLKVAERERPSLLILGRRLAGRDGLETCRAVRRELGDYGAEVPVVLLSGKEDASVEEGDSDEVTDWLRAPFSATYARTRVRAWLLREACRWVPAPAPADEAARMRALRCLGILDTDPEERFDRLTRLASALFDVPIALVSLVDAERQWFKSHHGIAACETSRETAFCAHAILSDEVLVVPDALLDPRFADNPLVTGEPHVRFYAGCPLTLPDGSRVGTLCLIGHRPRELDESSLRLLRDLASLAEQELAASRPS